MNPLRRIVKEIVLVPVRVVQGTVDAANETLKILDGKKKP